MVINVLFSGPFLQSGHQCFRRMGWPMPSHTLGLATAGKSGRKNRGFDFCRPVLVKNLA